MARHGITSRRTSSRIATTSRTTVLIASVAFGTWVAAGLAQSRHPFGIPTAEHAAARRRASRPSRDRARTDGWRRGAPR